MSVVACVVDGKVVVTKLCEVWDHGRDVVVLLWNQCWRFVGLWLVMVVAVIGLDDVVFG